MKKPRNEFHEAAIKGLKCARKLVSDFELLVSMCEQGEDIEAFQYSFAIHGRICKLFKIGKTVDYKRISLCTASSESVKRIGNSRNDVKC